MELYTTFTWTPRESYSLNNITNIELGEGKLDYNEYGNLKSLYTNDFQKFAEYNVRDVELLVKLEDKLKLISLSTHIAYKCCCNFEEVTSPIRTWDNFIYNDFNKRGVVLPPPHVDVTEDQLMGGFVKLPTTGIYDWVVSFDVNSLYPTIIRQCNLSPETITTETDTRFREGISDDSTDTHKLGNLINCTYDTKYLKEIDRCLTCNGNLIKRDKQGFLPKMVGDLYSDRVHVKGEMKKAKQELEKVLEELNKYE
jgi:DNA polymerase elongation subunit (family B)